MQFEMINIIPGKKVKYYAFYTDIFWVASYRFSWHRPLRRTSQLYIIGHRCKYLKTYTKALSGQYIIYQHQYGRKSH